MLLCCILPSCTRLMVGTVIEPNIANLQQQTDLDLVCEGAPAYLLILDSMLVSSPDSPELLMSALQSYSGYLAALEECGTPKTGREAAISEKSRRYGLRLLSQFLPLQQGPDDALFARRLGETDAADVPFLFWGAYGWLSWVRSQNGSPASIVDLVAIEKIMARLLELDEAYQGGSVHIFFGGYHGIKPAMLGGRPDLSEKHFKRAIELSGGTFLPAQTGYAEILARATFDRQLHDRLLKEVIDFPLDRAPGYGLSNTIAKRRAARLLAENYFGE
jgi:hypothetical protein